MNSTIRYFCFFLFLFFITGCASFHIGVKEEQINVESYPSSQEFLKNKDLVLKKNFSEPQLLNHLKDGKTPHIVQLNKAEDVQKALSGNIALQADKNGIANTSEWLLSRHVLSLPYKNVRTEFAFDPFPISYNTWEFGPDMDLLFITEKNESDPSSPYVLVRTIVTGTENIKTKTKEYIWKGLATAIVGVAKKLIF